MPLRSGSSCSEDTFHHGKLWQKCTPTFRVNLESFDHTRLTLHGTKIQEWCIEITFHNALFQRASMSVSRRPCLNERRFAKHGVGAATGCAFRETITHAQNLHALAGMLTSASADGP